MIGCICPFALMCAVRSSSSSSLNIGTSAAIGCTSAVWVFRLIGSPGSPLIRAADDDDSDSQV
jgi:hypothetical protein